MGSTTPSRSANRGFSFCVNFWAGNYETKYNIFRRNHVIGSAAQVLPYTEDLITFAQNAHHNLVDGNVFENCKHSVLYIDSSSVQSNVIRNNTIINHIHSALSMWGAGGNNLIEGNLLEASGGQPSSYAGPGNALQFQSPANILRYNVITRGGATDNPYSSVGGIAQATGGNQIAAISSADNRFYNNTIVKNDGPGLGNFWYPQAIDLGRSKYVNNIFYGNNLHATSNTRGIDIYYESTQSVPGGIRDLYVQNLVGNPSGSSAQPSTAESVIFVPTFGSLTAAAASTSLKNPSSPEFRGILQVDPRFANYAGGDYRLQSTSALINAGSALTNVSTSDAGSGTTLRLDDAHFFQDGRGVPGVQADWIAVGSVTKTAQITAVNYSANTVTLATAITRAASDKVWLYRRSDGQQVLAGAAPDVGAFESAAGAGAPPPTPSLTPPTNLRVIP
jgi:Periplasmic copper-binding protein (NosD)